jgi:dipeptidyl-peptidase 9
MDTPQRNAEGYERGSVLEHADGFPDVGDHRLVLVHGLIDENVHFTHTAALLDALVRRGKPYTLKLFPSERHGLRSQTASKYFHQFMTAHLMTHL